LIALTEAQRLLRIARRDLRMARRLLDPELKEASWGWALQQTLEKTLKAWLRQLGVQPSHSHDIARLLVLLERTGVDVNQLLPLRAITTFAVQGRYDDEPEELDLDRTAWCPMQQTLAPCRAASTTSPPDSAAAGPGDGDNVGSPCSRVARSALPLDPQLLEMLPF
jgi:HEPN domain-containing protein